MPLYLLHISMRKRLLLIILLLVALGTGLYFYLGANRFKKMLGGKGIAEGVIEYTISYPKVDEKSMMISGLPDKAYLRFKDNNISNDMSGMMGLINITYICKPADTSVEQMLTLINKKYVSDITPEQLKNLNGSYVESVEKGTAAKEIAGYQCNEAIVKLRNGETTRVYYTNDIAIDQPNWSNPYSKIDGVLMEFQLERYGVVMAFKAKSVNAEKLDAQVFKVSDDHKKIPFEELEKILTELIPVSQ
jgi:hypothetical protein